MIQNEQTASVIFSDPSRKMASKWLTLVFFLAGLCTSYGGDVNTTSQSAVEGEAVDITCYYTLEDSESVTQLYIDTYVRNMGFLDVARFYPNGTAVYARYGAMMRNRTSLHVGAGSVTFRFESVQCGDAGEYYCNLETNDTYSYLHMELTVKGPSSKPTLLLTKAAGCYEEGTNIEAACVGLVGGPTERFVWYAMREDNTTEEVTHLSEPGPLYRPHPSTCGYKRVSHITFNATEADDGMVLRCSIVDPDDDTAPSDGECGESCSQVEAIHLKRHPGKPFIANFKTDYCPAERVQVACYGQTGDHNGYFTWYKLLPGKDPINVTSQADPGSAYKLHNSCQYERASMLSIPADPTETGLVIRCLLRNDQMDISPSPDDDCDHHCAETNTFTIRDSCKTETPQKPEMPNKSGTVTLLGSVLVYAYSCIMVITAISNA